MNIVIYARFSSHSQTEQSIEGQLKVCYEYAESNHYTVVGEYIDRAISGTTDNRAEFQRMISDSDKHTFEGVLVYQLDRFARNRYDSAINKAKPKKNGVRALSAKENITDDASGILVEGVLESMAEYYSVELSQKIHRGMAINAEKCLSKATPDELIIFENTHEAIVDEETWHLAQKLRRKTKRTLANGTYSHRLSGLVYCSDCGKRLSYASPHSQHRADGKTYDADSNFRCPTYKSMYGECTMHFIKASTLDSLVDEAIRKVAAYVLKDEQAFLQQVKELTSASQAVVQTDSKKELVTAKKRIAELDNFIKKLYEGNASGKIPDRQFEKLMAQYDTEQQELEARVAEIEAKISELRQEEESGEMFVRLVKRYRDFTEITQTMLNEFIDKIVIYEATGGRTVNRSQRIDIYFNFIGQFVVEDTEEESLSRQEEEKRLAELKEQERKERRNETVRRYRQRKKEKKAAEAEAEKTAERNIA